MVTVTTAEDTVVTVKTTVEDKVVTVATVEDTVVTVKTTVEDNVVTVATVEDKVVTVTAVEDKVVTVTAVEDKVVTVKTQAGDKVHGDSDRSERRKHSSTSAKNKTLRLHVHMLHDKQIPDPDDHNTGPRCWFNFTDKIVRITRFNLHCNTSADSFVNGSKF